MPATARVQHIYNHKSGLPKDAVVNTFYFRTPASGEMTEQNAQDLRDIVMAFYDTLATGAAGEVRNYLAETMMAPLRHTFKIYQMEHDTPRAPVWQETIAVPGANNAQPGFPAEVAVCLSFRAALVSGQSMARRRGRIFLGPIRSSAATLDAAGHLRPDTVSRTAFVSAGKALQVAALAEGWPWVIRHGGTGDFTDESFASYSEVEHWWCDNAFDTQRRRGASPDSRITASM